MDSNEVMKLYDTVLSIPGMNDMVKVDFKLSRKMLMLLTSVIERGLNAKDNDKSAKLIEAMPKDSLQELITLSQELLKKAELTELSEKLKSFHSEK